VRLYLDEQQFECYALWLARTCEDGDISAALGLIFIHLDEEFAADRPDSVVTDIGLRRGRLGRSSGSLLECARQTNRTSRDFFG
jgi:hypothetical protein